MLFNVSLSPDADTSPLTVRAPVSFIRSVVESLPVLETFPLTVKPLAPEFLINTFPVWSTIPSTVISLPVPAFVTVPSIVIPPAPVFVIVVSPFLFEVFPVSVIAIPLEPVLSTFMLPFP